MKKLTLLIATIIVVISLTAQDTELWSQMDRTTPDEGIVCGMYSDPSGLVYVQSADDFTVPAGETWDVRKIEFIGHHDFTPLWPTWIQTYIYPDNGGKPDISGGWTFNFEATKNSGIYTAHVSSLFHPSGLQLTEGTYWLDMYANVWEKHNPSQGGWYWQYHNPSQIGNPFKVQDLDNLLGYGPLDWVTGYNLSGVPNDAHDLCFAVYGEVIPETPLKDWPIYSGVLLIIIFGVYRYRKIFV